MTRANFFIKFFSLAQPNQINPPSPDFACALWKKFAHQGWLYVSENFLCFYSFILGSETKLVIEIKDIKSLSKEKTMGGMMANAIRIVTIDDNEVQVIIVHFFK